jgi:hypothetical protein
VEPLDSAVDLQLDGVIRLARVLGEFGGGRLRDCQSAGSGAITLTGSCVIG